MEHSLAQENVWAEVIFEAVTRPWVHHMELGALWIQSYFGHQDSECEHN